MQEQEEAAYEMQKTKQEVVSPDTCVWMVEMSVMVCAPFHLQRERLLQIRRERKQEGHEEANMVESTIHNFSSALIIRLAIGY